MMVALTFTGRVLIPLDPHDLEALRQVCADGEILTTDVKKARNIKHHRMFFALLQLVILNQDTYRNLDDLLVDLKLRIGHYKEHVTAKGELVYVPKSISFDKMDQIEFGEFFKKAIVALAEMFPGIGDIDAIADELIARHAA
jgi:hypothetical protein